MKKSGKLSKNILNYDLFGNISVWNLKFDTLVASKTWVHEHKIHISKFTISKKIKLKSMNFKFLLWINFPKKSRLLWKFIMWTKFPSSLHCIGESCRTWVETWFCHYTKSHAHQMQYKNDVYSNCDSNSNI